MKQLIRVSCVIAFGFIVSACDKCGNWNIKTPQLCNSPDPKM